MLQNWEVQEYYKMFLTKKMWIKDSIKLKESLNLSKSVKFLISPMYWKFKIWIDVG